MGLSSAALTVPCTLRVWSCPFFFWAKLTEEQSSEAARMTIQTLFMSELLFPVLVGIFLFFFQEPVLFFLVFFEIFGGFPFQRFGANDLQSRTTLITTDGVAFVDVFLIHINLSIANRTFDHGKFLPNSTDKR